MTPSNNPFAVWMRSLPPTQYHALCHWLTDVTPYALVLRGTLRSTPHQALKQAFPLRVHLLASSKPFPRLLEQRAEITIPSNRNTQDYITTQHIQEYIDYLKDLKASPHSTPRMSIGAALLIKGTTP